MDNSREVEAKIVEFMDKDGWLDKPVTGDNYLTAFDKIIRYIEWLRHSTDRQPG